MSFVINTNTLSLTAQQNLNSSQKTLNSAIERLSSGSKINSAKDDAAGQAISNRMTSQINGLKQASSNANDGISMAQTTEGALNQINDNLQRVRELTVQASNGTNSQSDLDSIQNEINQRLEEIDRVSDQTAFNGTKVLDSDKTIKIQVGSEDNQTISIELKNMDTASLGMEGFKVDASAKAEVGEQVGFNETLGEIYEVKDGSGNVQAGVLAAKDSDGNLVAVQAATTPTTANGGYEAITYTDADGNSANATVALAVTSPTDPSPGAATVVGEYSDGTTHSVNAGDDWSSTAPTSEVDVANGPLGNIDAALTKIDDMRSSLGAIQNRFDSAINNISTTEINISSARSRITDADYATEVSNMSKAQILQQAGTSVLAQANQSTQGVLSLLR
ncbi:flagellin [Salinisphaera shabanensis T35B1]|uniref:FliC/FljB family flagellin n=2 Tax=Salinisphaera TaxID=180541 RepID=UPI00333FC586